MTPYETTKEGRQVGVKLSAGHLGFNDWVGFSISKPSVIVSEFREHRQDEEYLRIRCVGWATKSAEAYAWIDHAFPLLHDADETVVLDMLEQAEEQRKHLEINLKKGLVGSGGRKQISSIAKVSGSRLYAACETDFFRKIRAGDKAGWDDILRDCALKIYDNATEKRKCDPVAVAKHRRKLKIWKKT